jgi:hypothetical protein
MAGPPPREVTIVTSFPRAGVYRMWAQFQQAGKVHTMPFDLDVAEGAPNCGSEIVFSSLAIRRKLPLGETGC